MRATVVVLTAGLLATAAACTTSTATAPPAGSAAPAAVGAGKFVWYDLMTEDADASRNFYKELLDWKFETMTRASRPYHLIKTADGSYIGGVVDIEKRAGERGSQWLSYMSVSSVERAIAWATGAGSRLFAGPIDLNVGTVAILADPQGALLGIARLTAELPSSPSARVGHFFWTEYLAADDVKALAFYRDFAGLDSEVSATASGISYYVLKADSPRAGLFRIPDAVTTVKPNWLPYVCVDDPATLAARATQLGGTVLLAPSPQARNGTVAIVADPSGAAIALQKWPM